MAGVKDMITKVNDSFLKMIGKKKLEENTDNSEEKEKVVTNDQEMLSTIIKKIDEFSDDFNARLEQAEKKIKELEDKQKDKKELNELREDIKGVHTTLDEFSKFYELVCKQYDPFSEAKPDSKPEQQKKESKKKNKDPESKEESKEENSERKKEKKAESREEKIDLLKDLHDGSLKELIDDANSLIEDGNVDDAEKKYGEIMEAYKTLDKEVKPAVYDLAMELREKIKKAKT